MHNCGRLPWGCMSDIVLVHGTTQSAAGFAALVGLLEDAGHRAICVDVPSAAGTSAEVCADLLADQVPADVESPVVVAHSAAGLLLPALARRLDARHQVHAKLAQGSVHARKPVLQRGPQRDISGLGSDESSRAHSRIPSGAEDVEYRAN